MHRPARARWKKSWTRPRSSRNTRGPRSARTLRPRPLEDGTSTRGCASHWRWSRVNRPRPRLRHDHATRRGSRICSSSRRLGRTLRHRTLRLRSRPDCGSRGLRRSGRCRRRRDIRGHRRGARLDHRRRLDRSRCARSRRNRRSRRRLHRERSRRRRRRCWRRCRRRPRNDQWRRDRLWSITGSPCSRRKRRTWSRRSLRRQRRRPGNHNRRPPNHRSYRWLARNRRRWRRCNDVRALAGQRNHPAWSRCRGRNRRPLPCLGPRRSLRRSRSLRRRSGNPGRPCSRT